MKIILHRDEKGRINLTTYTTDVPRRYVTKNVYYPSYLFLRKLDIYDKGGRMGLERDLINETIIKDG